LSRRSLREGGSNLKVYKPRDRFAQGWLAMTGRNFRFAQGLLAMTPDITRHCEAKP